MHPALAISEALIVAVNWFALTNMVVCGLLFHSTTEPWSCGFCGAGGGGCGVGATKFEPFTVSVNMAPDGLAVVGLILLITGPDGDTGVIRKVAAFWLTPPPGPGFETVTCATPALATSEGKIASAI